MIDSDRAGGVGALAESAVPDGEGATSAVGAPRYLGEKMPLERVESTESIAAGER